MTMHKSFQSWDHCADITFPTSVEVGLVRDFIQVFTPTTESPRQYLWSGFMAVFGAALAPYICSTDGVRPVLPTLNIGTDWCRMSHGADSALELFEAIFRQVGICIFDGSFSPAGLSQLLREQQGSSLFIYLRFAESQYRELKCAPLQQALDDADGDRMEGQSHLSLLANHEGLSLRAQISPLLQYLTLITGVPTKRDPHPPGPGPHLVKELRTQITKLMVDVGDRFVASNNQSIEISFATKEAEQRWYKFYCSDIDPRNPTEKHLDVIGMKLMVILSLSKGEFGITSATVEAAIEFLEYQKHLRRYFAPEVAGKKPPRRGTK